MDETASVWLDIWGAPDRGGRLIIRTHCRRVGFPTPCLLLRATRCLARPLPSTSVTEVSEPLPPAPEGPAPASASPEPSPSSGVASAPGLGEVSHEGLVRIAAAFYGVVTVFAVGYAFFDRIRRDADGPDSDAFLGLSLPSVGGLLSGIGVGLVIVGVVHVGLRVVPAVESTGRLFARVLGPLGWKQALLFFLIMVVRRAYPLLC